MTLCAVVKCSLQL